MSQGNAHIVRQPLQARTRSRRTVDERLALRFPALAAASLRLIGRLRPRSRVRQAALARAAMLSVGASNRRDLEAVVASWDPDFEYRPDRKWVEAGLVESRYRGPAGYRTYVATADEVWGGANYLKPVELIDLGERIVLLAEGSMRALASGVPLTEAYAVVLTQKGGRVSQVQEYFDHAEALEAVGLAQ
jgi:ketosteroid isomerase-like protein